MLKSQNLVCPELLSQSDDVEITLEKLEHSVAHGKLSLFETRRLSNNSGGILFVGGPVASMEFHPYAGGICAIGAHRADQQTHEILRCYQGLAHIQLWRLSFESSQCLALISHKGNCTWDLKWKPEESPDNDSVPWSGTLAAALGDGTVMVYCINSAELDTSTRTDGGVAMLSPRSVHLRANRRFSVRSPVRVIEWSKDGNLLVVGAADGSIEVYNARSAESTWPKWSIPGHESVIVDMRWLSDFHLCSLGLSCVLRLRDIRESVALLEQNMEGLSGSMSMDTLEPNVAVIGGDYGYLRVVRLSGADGVMTRLPVRRVRLQTGSFRAMKSIPVAGHKSPSSCQTLLYTAGPEGLLHECKIPRPLWTSPEVCRIGRTKICERLRWAVKRAGGGGQAEFNSAKITLLLHLNKEITASASQTETTKNEMGELGTESTPMASGESLLDLADARGELNVNKKGNREAGKPAKKKISRRSRAVGKDLKDLDYSFFGESYNQKIVISRISVSERSDMVAVGIDGGMVTWLKLNLKVHDAAAREEEAHERRKSTEKRTTQLRAGPKDDKVIKPPRKRGRPRKYPLTPVKILSNTTTNSDKADSVNGDKADATNGVANAQKTVEKEKEKEMKGRPKAAPLIGPKRKRGRPRKDPLPSVEISAQGPLAKKHKTRDKMDDSPKGSTAARQLEPKGDGAGHAKRTRIVSAVTAPVVKNAETAQATSKDVQMSVEAETSLVGAQVEKAKTRGKDTAAAPVEKNVDIIQATGGFARTDECGQVALVTNADDAAKRIGEGGKMPAAIEAKRGAGRKRKTGTFMEGRGRKKRRGGASVGAGVALERIEGIRKGETSENRIGNKAAGLSTRGAAAANAASRSGIVDVDSAKTGRLDAERPVEGGGRREEKVGTEAVTKMEQLRYGGDKALRSGVVTSVGESQGLRGRGSDFNAVPCRLRRKAEVRLKLRVRAPREGRPYTDEVRIDGRRGGEKNGTEEGYREVGKAAESRSVVNANEENGQEGQGGKKVKVRLRVRARSEDKLKGGRTADEELRAKEVDRIILKLRVRTRREEGDEGGLHETRQELKAVERNEGTEVVGRSKRRRKPSWKVAVVGK